MNLEKSRSRHDRERERHRNATSLFIKYVHLYVFKKAD